MQHFESRFRSCVLSKRLIPACALLQNRSLTHYDILNVHPKATSVEIKKLYLRKCKELHPDKHKGDKNAHDRFVKVNVAYQTLSDPQKRSMYDFKLRGAMHSSYQRPSPPNHNFYHEPTTRKHWHQGYAGNRFHPGSEEFYRRHFEHLRQRKHASHDDIPDIDPKGIIKVVLVGATIIYISSFYVMYKRHQVHQQQNFNYVKKHLLKEKDL